MKLPNIHPLSRTWGGLIRVKSFHDRHALKIHGSIIVVGFLVLSAYSALLSSQVSEQNKTMEDLVRENKELTEKIADQNDKLSNQNDDIERQLEILEEVESNRDEAVQTIIGYLECVLTAMGEEHAAQHTRADCRHRFPEAAPTSTQASTQDSNDTQDDDFNELPPGVRDKCREVI